MLSKKRQQRWADDAARRFFFSDDAAELMALRIRGRGESRGVMVLDEAHDWMNSRAWQQDDRMEFVRWFSRHRKLGWDVYLVTQYLTNIDSQVRNLCEYHVTLLNLRNGLKVAGVPLCPVNVFLAVWRWNGGAAAQQNVSKRNVNRLTPWIANLYDTFGGTGLAEAPAEDRYLLPLELPTADSASADASVPGSASAPTPADGITEELVSDTRPGELAFQLLQTREGPPNGDPSLLSDGDASCSRSAG
jgi:hypothetical protein